jgi:hypothetical protein
MTGGPAAEVSRSGSLVPHLLVVLAVSVGYESLFLHHGINVIDEGWPLYAAMRLHAGGTLYRDAFFVFPPGHLLSAWLAYALDPPGVVLARALYASFSVSLCVGLYLLGRRLMPAGYALFGTLLLAVGATSAHMQQLVFGYRYLVISLLALFAFARWLEDREARWIFAAGAFTGLSLVFRLTPAFAVGCAVALGIVAAGGRPRDWLRAWSFYGAGLLVVALPVVVWFLVSVGPETLWLEAVVRPVAMTDLQSLPMPPLAWSPPGPARKQISDWFVGVQFRAWTLLYAVYAVGLAAAAWKAIRERRAMPDPLLAAFVVWGAVYFLRSFGRSDSAHLYSAIPPVCLLIGHAASRIGAALPARGRPAVLSVAGVVFLGGWIYLGGGDRVLDPAYRGEVPLAVLRGEVSLRPMSSLRSIDPRVAAMVQLTRPGDVVLDLSASPLLHVLSGRMGPGHADVIMPGTFLDDAEEMRFLARLRAAPPALVVWPGKHFDEDPSRAVTRSAPRVAVWVQKHYRPLGGAEGRFVLMVPRRPGAAD